MASTSGRFWRVPGGNSEYGLWEPPGVRTLTFSREFWTLTFSRDFYGSRPGSVGLVKFSVFFEKNILMPNDIYDIILYCIMLFHIILCHINPFSCIICYDVTSNNMAISLRITSYCVSLCYFISS